MVYSQTIFNDFTHKIESMFFCSHGNLHFKGPSKV